MDEIDEEREDIEEEEGDAAAVLLVEFL